MRELRTARGMTQVELASASGITQASISRYEQGADNMSLPSALKVARGLGVTVDQLVGNAPIDADGGVDHAAALDTTGRDPYPNWRRLQLEPDFQTAPKLVQEAIFGLLGARGDRPIADWVRLLDRLLALDDQGDLAVMLSLAGRERPRPTSRRTG